jgi:hypothetical protein
VKELGHVENGEDLAHDRWGGPAIGVVNDPRRSEPDSLTANVQKAAAGRQDVLDPIGVGAIGERDHIPVPRAEHVDGVRYTRLDRRPSCSTIPKPGSQPATSAEIRLVTTRLKRATERGITTAECYLSSRPWSRPSRAFGVAPALKHVSSSRRPSAWSTRSSPTARQYANARSMLMGRV